MEISYNTFYSTIFPIYTFEQLIHYKQELIRYVEENRETMKEEDLKLYIAFDWHLEGAIISKKLNLYSLDDEDLREMRNDNYKQQRYMKRCEDAIEESSEDNKKGFYEQWAELEEEMDGIEFEFSRRKFFEERSNEILFPTIQFVA